MLEQSADLLQSLRPARRRKVARRPGLSALFADDLFAGATPGTAATDKPVMVRELLKRTTPNDITQWVNRNDEDDPERTSHGIVAHCNRQSIMRSGLLAQGRHN